MVLALYNHRGHSKSLCQLPLHAHGSLGNRGVTGEQVPRGRPGTQQIEAKKNLSPAFLIDESAPAFSGACLVPQYSRAVQQKQIWTLTLTSASRSELGRMGLSFKERSRQGQKEPDVGECAWLYSKSETVLPGGQPALTGAACWLRLRVGQRSGPWRKERSLTKFG